MIWWTRCEPSPMAAATAALRYRISCCCAFSAGVWKRNGRPPCWSACPRGHLRCLGDHVFPAKKYGLIREQLLREGFADESDFVPPARAEDDDILLVHDREWVRRLKAGTLSYLELLKLEIPCSGATVDAFWLAAG